MSTSIDTPAAAPAATAAPPAPTAEVTGDRNKGATITLHWLEKSRSQRILWLLEELELKYELKVYKRGADFLAGPELKEVHELGKSPVVSIKPADGGAEFVLPESAFIIEYLTEHFGPQFAPTQWQAGKEGQVGGETAEWLRYRHLLHYGEGSLMTFLILGLVTEGIKTAPVPFFIKPITKRVGQGVEQQFLTRNFALHFQFLEDQLKTSGGDFFCGSQVTGPDFLLIFPLEASLQRNIWNGDKFPLLKGFVDRVLARPAYARAVQKIKDVTGTYDPVIG